MPDPERGLYGIGADCHSRPVNTETLRRLYGPEREPVAPTHTWQLHSRLVHGLAVLHDGEHFVSSSEDDGLLVVALADGQVVHRLTGHDGPVNSLCLTPDGTRLITGGDDHTVQVRATDGTGAVQPEARATPFPSGATGWHTISVTVTG